MGPWLVACLCLRQFTKHVDVHATGLCTEMPPKKALQLTWASVPWQDDVRTFLEAAEEEIEIPVYALPA